ncbi:inositol monophosphatase family protein [Paremcibacter congregatus]|uniref:inositol monophosphatase family protein n=1 Tax=Paremcibacter congregatus TaxID=2043170 RepID=UPI003A922F54
MSGDIIGELVIDVAKSEIVPRYNNLKEADIAAKSPGDMVTIADLAAEKALTRALKREYPTAIIGGEESISEAPNLLAEITTADHAFLIDPVDGTNNFIKGDPRFALMLTELRKGQVEAAWIYLPVTEKLASARKGEGARLNDRKVVTLAPAFEPAKMVAAAHLKRFPPEIRRLAEHNLKDFKENRPAFCAGHDYIMLLEGAKDFSVYYRTLPWDHLPGGFIFTEAGGYVRTLFDQKKYRIGIQDKGLLSAPSEALWHKIRQSVFPDRFTRS